MLDRYKVILFDADDTLLDFKANEHASLELIFKKIKYPLTNVIRNEFVKINRDLWYKYEQGAISREAVINSRFQILFDNLGIQENGKEIGAMYTEVLGMGSQMIDSALNVCNALYKSHDLYIVTNGSTDMQVKRLNASGLNEYMKGIFISESVKHQKPSRYFFNYVFTTIDCFDLSRTIIVGDSLSSDIQGGINSGIDTCWFNPDSTRNMTDLNPTYEISSLDDLFYIE